MLAEEMFDVSPPEVTPEAGEGTLGTWRFRTGPRLSTGGAVFLMWERAAQANQRCAGRARSQPERFGPTGQAAQGQPRSEPDWGKPADWDRRGACGNVATGVGLRREREWAGSATEPKRACAADLSRLPYSIYRIKHVPFAITWAGVLWPYPAPEMPAW